MTACSFTFIRSLFHHENISEAGLENENPIVVASGTYTSTSQLGAEDSSIL